MKKLNYSIFINATREKVWHAMFDKESYEEWTKAFGGSSSVKGDWSKGSKMLFLGENPETGEQGGMVSEVAENTPFEFLSLKHIGILVKGVEDTTSDEARKWTPAFENYTFTEKDGGTELLVELDSLEENAEMFNEMWPAGLQKLKEIAER